MSLRGLLTRRATVYSKVTVEGDAGDHKQELVAKYVSRPARLQMLSVSDRMELHRDGYDAGFKLWMMPRCKCQSGQLDITSEYVVSVDGEYYDVVFVDKGSKPGHHLTLYLKENRRYDGQ
jgi:head-tail adaptor